MIISINAEKKAFDKTQQFMRGKIKLFFQLQIEGNFLNPIKSIYKKQNQKHTKKPYSKHIYLQNNETSTLSSGMR